MLTWEEFGALDVCNCVIDVLKLVGVPKNQYRT